MDEPVISSDAPRRMLRWPVAIVVDSAKGQAVYHGATLEISISGCTVLCDSNLPSRHPVDLVIFLPPIAKDAVRVTLQVKAKISSTVLSNRHKQFLCSLHFDKFAGTGRATLEQLLR